ncbi:MAG: patatin-like phospholipase family protein [Arachidicoccus sp.]|nr:patatin-like phospholipase family protein [Arachidicoccus sp.]
MSISEIANKKVGLVLSGGGMRGIGHLGVIKALEEHNIKPCVLSGTSAGAIIGAFYAAGHSPDEIMSIAQETRFFSPVNLRLRKGGWFGTSAFKMLYQRYFPDNKLENLKIPLYVAATDISEANTEYFNEGDLCNALLASACLPLVFPAVSFNGKTYLDGGITDNLPIEPIKTQCDFLIGVHVNALDKHVAGTLSRRQMLDRSYHLLLNNTVYMKVPFCDLFIDPPDMTRFSMFDKKQITEMFDYTYDYTLQLLQEKGY